MRSLKDRFNQAVLMTQDFRRIRKLIFVTLELALAAWWVASAPRTAHAQPGASGTLTGAVTGPDGAPLAGVTVRAAPEGDTARARYTVTHASGIFRFNSLAPGAYTVRFSLLGYLTLSRDESLADGAEVKLDVQLEEAPVGSQEVIVTASRHPEKATNAPSSVTVIPAQEIRQKVLATPTDILSSVPGIDIAHEGIAMSTYSSRSFHSVFGSDMLTMNDYHSLEVPAIGGFYGILIPEIPADIERVEIVRGPGSALYGPEAATGVIHFISKSPFESQGTDVSVAGGQRDYFDGALRYAQALSDNFAFKVSGHILRANDWSIADDPKEDTARKNALQTLTVLNLSSGPVLQSEVDSLSRIGNRDSLVEVYSFDASADAILSDNSTANVTGGLTRIVNQIALTEDFGGAQIKNWQYEYLLGHVNVGDLFVQGAINHNDTKDSYFLVTGAPIIDRSTTYNAQIQDEYDSIEHEKLTYGADLNAIHPVTDGTLYGPDDGHANISIFGAYLQSQTSLFDNALDLVLAGRLDKHNYLTNPIFSPRAAAVYHFASDQLFRAMYNVTYLFPSVTDLYADILFASDPFGFNALGIGAGPNIRYVAPYVSGLHFTANGDGSYNMNSTLAPGSTIASNNAVTALWPTFDTLAKHALDAKLSHNDSLAAFLLLTVPAPNAQQVKTYLAYLNLHPNAKLSNLFLQAPNGQPLDISSVQPQHQRTLELDYQGEFGKSVQFEVDAYQTHYTAIRASTVALTPNVFADDSSLRQYLIDSLTPRLGPANALALADSLTGSLASLPLGVVQASGGAASDAHPYDVLIGTRDYLENAITFYGVDLFTTIKANDDWTFDGSFSWLNKNYWYASELNSTADSTQQSPFSLNMPKYRFSVGAKYSGLARGLSIELRDRWSDAFLMNDNYYIGDVGARHVLDFTANYRIQSDNSWNNLLLTLSITNLLDNVHQDFIGAPFIGRLAVLRAAYTLPPL